MANTPIARLPDWRPRLTAWLHTVRHMPFEEGRHDCALFAAGAVAAMTGVDFAAPFRGRYTTTRGGMRVLRRAGFADHIALAAAHLPQTSLPWVLEGDLVVMPSEMGPALWVVQGAMVYLPGLTGTALLSISGAQSAFKVG
jgi:hypothetical protein